MNHLKTKVGQNLETFCIYEVKYTSDEENCPTLSVVITGR